MTHARVDRAAPGKELRASEAGRSATGPQSALQREADRAIATRPLSRLQKLADARTPMQRVLSHTTPIVTGEVDVIVQRADSVWELTNQAGETVIIKFEPMMNKTAAEFEARAELTREMAFLVLERVPDANPVDANDEQEILAACALAAGNADAALLANRLQTRAANNDYVYKCQTVDVGDNLLDMGIAANLISAANYKPLPGLTGKKPGQAASDVHKDIMNPKMMTSLGKMAAFDLIVGNEDRFHHDTSRPVNLKNLDVGGGVALGIDNLNPFTDLVPGLANWLAAPVFKEDGTVEDYAQSVVEYLAIMMSYTPKINRKSNPLDELVQPFKTGFKTASITLRGHAYATLKPRLSAGGLTPQQQNAAQTILDRAKFIPF